jgi:SAM-dependent methyltransferase
MTMNRNYVITPQQSRLWFYEKAIKEEIQHLHTEESKKRQPHNHPRLLEYKGRILGGRLQVSDFADWTEFLLKEYGPKQNCLSLGSGIGRVERYLLSIGFATRFETIELSPIHNEMIMKVNSRIDAREGDLNFVELKPNTYDFILCHGVLHHLINLEHIIEQINHALKPDGRLLIYEYIGEDRWQFSEAQLSRLRRMFPNIKLNNIPVWRVNGFEAVRSSDLLELITKQFGQVCERSVNYGGVFFPLIICNWLAAKRNIERIVEIDVEVSRSNELPPCYHMGIYRKSNVVIPQAIPWTDEQLKVKLLPLMSTPQRLMRIGWNVKNMIRLRTRLRSLISHLR